MLCLKHFKFKDAALHLTSSLDGITDITLEGEGLNNHCMPPCPALLVY